MRTSVHLPGFCLRHLCVAGRPPGAVGHLRGAPESRPGVNTAVSCAAYTTVDLHIQAARAFIAHLTQRTLHESVALMQLDLSMV